MSPSLPARPRFQDSAARAQQQQRRRAEGQRILARSRETTVPKPTLEERLASPIPEVEVQQTPSQQARSQNRRALNNLPYSRQLQPHLPPTVPTRDRIAQQSVIFDFKKLTILDLIRIFIPKLDATLKRLRVFDDIEPEHEDDPGRYQNVQKLIERLKHYKQSLQNVSTTRTKEEFQSWNFGLHEIKKVSFAGFRKNRRHIIKYLSDIWDSNYFEYW